MIDWSKIKTEYITTNISYRELSEKYGISLRNLGERASKEKWVELRQQKRDKITTKIVDADIKKQVDRYARMLDLTDKLMDRIEQSIKELDMHMATKTHKTKTIEYNNFERPDKPTKEVVDEIEEVIAYQSIVDKLGLKQVASALRDLKEIQMLKSEMDQQEQKARIAKLEREAKGDDEQDKTIILKISDDLNDYAN